MFREKDSLIQKFIFVLILLLMFAPNVQLLAQQQDANKPKDVFEMSLEELMKVEIVSSATLTKTTQRLVPAAVTTITAEQIQASGARSLFELLDIYVPNLQWWHNHWEADNMGLRGILSDRDDKYLLLVNGRVMNERTHYGALSERDLVELKDIHHIDVVRGPGSAMYGPGAVAMVINIITHNANTFEGTDITSRLGAIEEFYSWEVRHGQKFKDGDGGIFVYSGVSRYRGANAENAPQIYGVDFPATPGGDAAMPWDGHKKGKPLTSLSINDGEDFRNVTPMKLHVEITRGNWDIWGRYTQGGKQIFWPTGLVARWPYGWTGSWALPLRDSGYGYRQATGFIGYKKDLDEKTDLDMSFSYDMFDFRRIIHTWLQEAYLEQKYISKAMIRRDITSRQKIAFGVEILHGEYGYDNLGWPYGGDAYDGAFNNVVGGMPRWSTNMISFMGEHQWAITDQLTSFIGARYDSHTFTNKMFSPRASLVYAPNKQDTYKVMWARSVRANYEEQLKDTSMRTGQDSAPEKLDSLEVRYERKQNENLDLAASWFLHYQLQLIGWSNAANGEAVVGNQKEWGLELEAMYHTDRARLGISHGYTKLIDFQLADPRMVTTDPLVQASAMPYGYGHDLQRWANHITKVQGQYKLDEKWTLDGSLRIYWGFPGLRDYANYDADRLGYTLESKDPYRGSYYLNLGLQYQPKKNLTFRIDGYNLLGIFSKDFNKRNYGGEGSADFRDSAPAVGVSMTYKF
ncbi:MAG: TonB-dependent receptor [Sedimentisphaerales bacterium]